MLLAPPLVLKVMLSVQTGLPPLPLPQSHLPVALFFLPLPDWPPQEAPPGGLFSDPVVLTQQNEKRCWPTWVKSWLRPLPPLTAFGLRVTLPDHSQSPSMGPGCAIGLSAVLVNVLESLT